MVTSDSDGNLIRGFGGSTIAKSSFAMPVFVLLFVVVVLLGLFTGFGLSRLKKGTASTSTSTTKTGTKAVGIVDKKTFKDQAEGILQEGGIEGEGSFHLERPGGKSQNVYLTSSTVDLAPYVGKKVRVWGQTFTAEKAGWLMDVGLVESLN